MSWAEPVRTSGLGAGSRYLGAAGLRLDVRKTPSHQVLLPSPAVLVCLLIFQDKKEKVGFPSP